MNYLRHAPLAFAIAACLSFATVALSQSGSPTPEQQKELDAAREELLRASQRLADLSRKYGGSGHGFMPQESARPIIGVLLATDQQSGVRITGVSPDGPAAKAGIRSGDRLLSVGGDAITGKTPEARVDMARELLRNLDTKKATKLGYQRDGRKAETSVTPKLDHRIMLFTSDGQMMQPGGNVSILHSDDGGMEIQANDIEIGPMPQILALPDGGKMVIRRGKDDGEMEIEATTAPLALPALQSQAAGVPHIVMIESEHPDAAPDGQRRIDKRVIRIDCKGDAEECRRKAQEHAAIAPHNKDGVEVHSVMVREACKPGAACTASTRLSEAFRWQGLNLASMDAQLGRYFGTSEGVLVLSTGPMLTELQPGDVIRKVDGKSVLTPRQMMDALRGKPADSTVAVEFQRDRKPGHAQIKVPKAMPLIAPPPAPPAPPTPPTPPAPPAPPALPHH